mmetsp:Transcript_5977/g.17305  ORF Transcript_5977/g.17305 Transcript_5977/m.17305 type:complete len:313 (-) Transcript_5977:26-964(-)|eukprot:CAMPEP_0176178188 /NCGR_PEP_ID=MMETSP0120_2-20121206/91302_1 /TAXON_ID=160619 /ORGANISM="Kryptoperidinium foliaceum, Strain CCMP 1326" /LENGTH=312 /DNA_ID=CAMNT_0017516337 /DNA_START=86 /DNA_END=1024 /DNA_ORIENTATION=+
MDGLVLPQFRFAPAPPLPHHPPLPSWLQEHCQRLMDGEESIRNLNLNLRRMDPRMMRALVLALKQHDIQAMNMTSTLDIRGLNSDETLLPLALLLKEHSTLQLIHLSYNQLEDVSILKESLSQPTCVLQELHLDHNQLTTASAIALAEGLAQNPQSCLKTLHLNSNRIGDKGGVALGKMLMSNTSLRKLCLAKNRLGRNSLQSFWQALHTNNTTLWELQLDDNPKLHSFIQIKGQMQRYLQANRAGRYLLHQDPPPPLSLWPHVLERCTRQSSSCIPPRLSDPQFYFLQEVPALTNRREENVDSEMVLDVAE